MSDNDDFDDDDIEPIIFDNGSFTMKAGYSGEDAPRVDFRSIVGRPSSEYNLARLGGTESYVGDQAQRMRSLLTLNNPVQDGIITNWDNMEKLWHHTFYNELVVAPEEHPLFLTEPYLNPKRNHEKMMETMFEVFYPPAIYIYNTAELSLAHSGRTCGVVIESGETMTRVVPILDTKIIPNSVQTINIGGHNLTLYLQKILNQRGYKFLSAAEFEIVRDIKEKLSFVSLYFESELADAKQVNDKLELSYELPDGQMVYLGTERFRPPEILFKPSLAGLESPGIHSMTISAIEKADVEIRNSLYANIIFSGGNTLFRGIDQRLQKEITQLLLTGTGIGTKKKVGVFADPDRKYSAWIGGATLSSIASFQSRWITKDEYEEFGTFRTHSRRF